MARLATSLALFVVLALLAGGRFVEAAAPDCTASAARDGAAPRALSTPVVVTVTCDAAADVEVALPRGDHAAFSVAPGETRTLEDERAYLCTGHSPLVRVTARTARGEQWADLLPIAGLGRLPACDVLLSDGVTEITWRGARLPVATALSADALGGSNAGVSAWLADPGAPWGVRAWGDRVPATFAPLEVLEPGRRYYIESAVERTWTFPDAAPAPSYFDDAQIVSFYGHPGVPAMGILGAHSPADAANELQRWLRDYDALNGGRGVIGAFHVIVAVAQASSGADGTYLGRLSDEGIAAYVEEARERGMLVFLDVQVGWADPLEEVQRLEPFLREPHVHLALDPEFATAGRGEPPGEVIGSLGADDVNAVQAYLAGLVEQHGLPPKILVLHQFLDSMLTARTAYDDVPAVEVTIDMDGFGPQRLKLQKYDIYALGPAAERSAIKLFFLWDTPLLTPRQIQDLDLQPDLVIYQ